MNKRERLVLRAEDQETAAADAWAAADGDWRAFETAAGTKAIGEPGPSPSRVIERRARSAGDSWYANVGRAVDAERAARDLRQHADDLPTEAEAADKGALGPGDSVWTGRGWHRLVSADARSVSAQHPAGGGPVYRIPRGRIEAIRRMEGQA